MHASNDIDEENNKRAERSVAWSVRKLAAAVRKASASNAALLRSQFARVGGQEAPTITAEL